MYEENYKSQMKKIKDLSEWKDLLCSQIGRLNIVKMSILPNLIHRLNVVKIKISASYLVVDIHKLVLKFIREAKNFRHLARY